MNTENISIFILSGGFGTRLKEVLDKNTPKPMADINGVPFLAYKITQIRNYFPENQIYLLTHYLSECIEKYFEKDAGITCIKESSPLGTGGSIKNAINTLGLKNNDKLLVFNGDTYLKPDLKKLLHVTRNGIAIVACYCKKTLRFNTLKINNNKIIKFIDKTSPAATNYINGGCYYFDNLNYLKSIKSDTFSIEEKFKELVTDTSIGVLIYNDIFIDIGVPEDYTEIQKLNLNE
tara:strand:+ start:82 stop:783 length:702 start_codon:yes stop_codon:yes gene_type:complete